MRSFEVNCDTKAMTYFESQSLDIIVLDDLAPIAGNALGSNQNEADEDMIGVCKIPLECLATGISMRDKFPIRRINDLA